MAGRRKVPRLTEKTPSGRWQTTTFLGALRAEGFVAPLTVDGAMNGSLFLAWIKQHFAPRSGRATSW